MSRWGAACGISLHAELLADGLMRLGYEVEVYAPTLESANRDWHHVVIEGDAPWVKRVYGEVDELEYPGGGFFEAPPADADVVIVEGYSRLPWLALRPWLADAKRRGAAAILVVHHMLPRDLEPLLEDIDLWDYITVFDDRFAALVERVEPRASEKTRIIPYPHLVLEAEAVDRPDVGDAAVLFSFGRQPPNEYIDYLRAVKRLVEKGRRVVYRVVRSADGLEYSAPWLIVERRRLDAQSLYAALRGSDIHLIPKWEHPGVVISSTLAQTLYSGVPTIVPDTRYFERVPDALTDPRGVVVKYPLGDVKSLVWRLELLLEDESLRERVSGNAVRYALERSPEKVAAQYARLS